MLLFHTLACCVPIRMACRVLVVCSSNILHNGSVSARLSEKSHSFLFSSLIDSLMIKCLCHSTFARSHVKLYTEKGHSFDEEMNCDCVSFIESDKKTCFFSFM